MSELEKIEKNLEPMIFPDGVRDAAGGHDSVQEQLLPLRRHQTPHQERQMTEGQ